MGKVDSSADGSYVEDLTWREQEVLSLLADRLTNREIGDRLHLAESTVKDYVGGILSKLYVKNRRQAVEKARALGLLEPGQKHKSQINSRLPPEPTPFVGRKSELAHIQRLLKESRMLTLTGPGGIGKTRLAMKAAQTLSDDFDDGCFFVPLAPIQSVDRIIQTTAEALRFPLATQEDPLRQLLRYLREKRLLLLLDNYEHLLDGASIVNEILQAAPWVKILTTSREKLNLQRETTLIVEGLVLPVIVTSDEIIESDAITLFLQSARRVRPDYEYSAKELGPIVQICQIVQGMPLAIELAASWLHILNVDEIATEIEKGLEILATELRDAPERHRSIRAVFDHSWSLMPEAEQEIFMRLSVFRGGFTRQAAQQVAKASLQQLADMVNKSLLSHNPQTGRLEIHELLRQYALEKLKSSPETGLSTQEAHAAYFAEFTHLNWENLKGSKQMEALAAIEADIENVRTAWRYYLKQKNAPQIWKFIYGLRHVY